MPILQVTGETSEPVPVVEVADEPMLDVLHVEPTGDAVVPHPNRHQPSLSGGRRASGYVGLLGYPARLA